MDSEKERSQQLGASIAWLTSEIKQSVFETVKMKELPPEFGIMIVLSSSWMMHECSAPRVEITGLKD